MRRRAELTFSENVLRGRHGWVRLTPAYSVRLVEEILASANGARTVYEPFCGTGTTPLSAAYSGLDAVATDINPFLVWLARVKCAAYAPSDRARLLEASRAIASRLRRRSVLEVGWVPALRNLSRWWNEGELAFLSALAEEIPRSADGPALDLLRVVFCRTLITLSNAAFDHPSMSFRGERRPTRPRAVFLAQLAADTKTVADSCLDNPTGTARIDLRDARGLGRAHETFDLLITSPPYPNRMSYVRELRPYMYWLGHLEAPSSAGELDWKAIGGTWGIATSRLKSWQPTGAFVPRMLRPVLAAIRAAHPTNGALMATYVHKYFDDMAHHFADARARVHKGGSVHYIIGNATFYGHVVAAERLFGEQLLAAGFSSPNVRPIRKRNSKKELYEFHVSAQA